MKYIIFFFFLIPFLLLGQQDSKLDRPLNAVPVLKNPFQKSNTIGITQPPSAPVRAMAEWEELEAIAITWSAFWDDPQRDTLLARITKEVVEECDVVILCDACNKIKSKLFNITGLDNLNFEIPQSNGTSLETKIILRPVSGGTNRIWIRDYGAHTVYTNEVDTLLFVDWKYSPDHPLADTMPSVAFAEQYSVPLYTTTADDYSMRLDGGNFLTDGMGTAFSSELVNSRNSFCEDCDIQLTAQYFMGIHQYHILPQLLHDVIHHVDMYMKIIDEETLIFGEYPPEAADYERLEANVEYIKNNVKTPYGNDYKIIRIQMPADQNGEYPGVPLGESAGCSAIGEPCFRTYINALFINKSILVPTYGIPYDETALEIWRAAKPGYRIVGIDCNGIIPQYGAIHCVTKEIGVKEPLWITHERIKSVCTTEDNTGFVSKIKHRTGIREALIYYRTDPTEDFSVYEMDAYSEDQFAIFLPNAREGTTIDYYFEAIANSGKKITRPLAAPQAYWSYTVNDCTLTTIDNSLDDFEITSLFPNPAIHQTQLQIKTTKITDANIQLFSILGQPTTIVKNIRLKSGVNTVTLPLSGLDKGVYQVLISTPFARKSHLILTK